MAVETNAYFVHLLMARLRVNAYLCLEQDLIDPQLRHRSRIRIGDLGQLHSDTLRKFRELLFRSLALVRRGLKFYLPALVQIADRAVLILQRAVVQFHRLQARRRRFLGILAKRSVERTSSRPVRLLVIIRERYALRIDVTHYVLFLQLRRLFINFLRGKRTCISVFVVKKRYKYTKRSRIFVL